MKEEEKMSHHDYFVIFTVKFINYRN